MATSDCREDEGEFLCEMFGESLCAAAASHNIAGEEGRFVEFVNQTGRAVRLVSRLEVVAMPSQAWTSRLPLPAATRHTWRFLGHDVAFPLFLMPDPWQLAKQNSYYWTAEFVDSCQEQQVKITFDKEGEVLRLSALPDLKPQERTTVRISASVS